MAAFLDRIQKLPAAIQDLLMSEEIAELNDRILTDHDVPEEKQIDVLRALQEVYLKDRSVEMLETRYRELLPDWSDDRRRALTRDFIGYRLLPMSGYLRGVHDEIVRLGGDPLKYPQPVVAKLSKTIAREVRDAIAAVGIVLQDEAIERRFLEVCETYLRGGRDAREVLDVLTRGSKTGGVGLSTEQAQDLVNKLKTLQGTFINEDPQDERVMFTRRTSASSEALALGAEEEEEVRRAHPVAARSGAEDIRGAADRVIARVGAKFKHEEAAKRFRSAIESRLRDIRDRQETFDLLTRATTAGGLGIPADRVERVLAIVEEEFEKLHPPAKPQADSRKPQAVVIASEVKLNAAISDERRGGATSPPAGDHVGSPLQSAVIATKVALPSPPPLAVRPMIALPPPPPVAELVHPVPPKAKNNESGIRNKGIEPTVVRRLEAELERDVNCFTSSPTTRARRCRGTRPPSTVYGEAKSRDLDRGAPRFLDSRGSLEMTRGGVPKPPAVSPPDLVKPKQVPPPRPQAAAATPPTPAPPSLASSGRPKLQDIRSVPPRLIGPVEELGRLTLEDFRKIARAPTDAAARVLEKVKLLEKDSYTKRAEGIRAFRESPLILLYADIVNTALLGKKPIEVAVRERREGDRNAVTIEEVAALQQLNTQLRF